MTAVVARGAKTAGRCCGNSGDITLARYLPPNSVNFLHIYTELWKRGCEVSHPLKERCCIPCCVERTTLLFKHELLQLPRWCVGYRGRSDAAAHPACRLPIASVTALRHRCARGPIDNAPGEETDGGGDVKRLLSKCVKSARRSGGVRPRRPRPPRDRRGAGGHRGLRTCSFMVSSTPGAGQSKVRTICVTYIKRAVLKRRRLDPVVAAMASIEDIKPDLSAIWGHFG
jgi:hypothetical protein